MKIQAILTTIACVLATGALAGCLSQLPDAQAKGPEADAPKKTQTSHKDAPRTAARAKPSETRTANLSAPPDQVEELGHVRWLRDYDEGIAQSKKTGKPVLVLFTEVPGCHTVTSFGNGPLTHPLVVDAIESEFVPVAIYNNVKGKDRKILNKFGEPTWNNPVVRIINPKGKDLAPRFAGPYTKDALMKTMRTGLEQAGKAVPAYMTLLEREFGAERSGTETATFSMYCFWSGEATLASMDGVVASRTGFAAGREVVELTYDPTKTSYATLAEQARKSGGASGAVASSKQQLREAKATFGSKAAFSDRAMRHSQKDDKYQLRHTKLRHVPMTEAQASLVNAAIGKKRDPFVFLSPKQRALAHAIQSRPSAAWPDALFSEDLRSAWNRSLEIATTAPR